jgi:ABC-type branched-subunit amino acid transport system substrate-binding protein
MRETTRWHRSVALFGAAAMVLAACGGDNGDDGGDGEAADPDSIATDFGVTSDPCPDAVNEDNGCIYLGVLSDLTEGPFAALGVEILAGQRAFWQAVNEDGGIADAYDVDIDTYTRDTVYDPQTHASEYRAIEPEILALAQTLGTPPTEAILPDMDVDDVVGIPASWWSGAQFNDQDNGLILDSGYSYCIEAMIGLDYINEEVTEIGSVQAVGYPGDYGGDFGVGVEEWASANGVDFVGQVSTLPNAAVGTQDEAISQIVSSGADVIAVATGPGELAEIVGQSVAQGFEGVFVGAVPTWNPALLDSPAAPALEAAYYHIGPWEAFDGGSDAHAAMQESTGGELPTNDGYTFGWIWSYPMLTALQNAADNGQLRGRAARP